MNKEITNVSIDVLKVHPRNTEFFDDISGAEYEEFKNSIKEEGIISEIIVAPDMTIISGHQRYKAAKELGIKMIPIRIREDLIDEDKKLKVLLAANFGRSKNDDAKQRKVAVEYVRLCGYGHGEIGKNHSQNSQNENSEKLTLEEIAKRLGTSKANLTRALSIERNLTESMKELLDTGVISKTVASDVITSLSKDEQEELIKSMDITKKITQKEAQQYINEIKQLKENPPIPSDYDSTKRELQDYKNDYNNLKSQFNEKVSELQELRKQIENMKVTEPTEQYNKKLKDSTIFFCSKVADFIEKVGGYVWLSDHLNELPDYERKSYVNAVKTIYAWAENLLSNIND